MKRYLPAAIIVLSGVGVLLGLSLGAPQRPKPSFYVGSRVCMPCHGGKRGCDQYSLWRLSKHAKAYAALSLPQTFEVAEISGVDIEPRESAICQGCHATASTAEPWQIDPTFHHEDGVQCEVCHGPAGLHVQAMKSGHGSSVAALPMPTPQASDMVPLTHEWRAPTGCASSAWQGLVRCARTTGRGPSGPAGPVPNPAQGTPGQAWTDDICALGAPAESGDDLCRGGDADRTATPYMHDTFELGLVLRLCGA